MLTEIANWQFKHCKIQICPVKVCKKNLSITRSHCFHFPNSNISVTGKTFGLTASIVLFSDPLETTASKPHRMKSQSVRISGSFLFLIR